MFALPLIKVISLKLHLKVSEYLPVFLRNFRQSFQVTILKAVRADLNEARDCLIHRRAFPAYRALFSAQIGLKLAGKPKAAQALQHVRKCVIRNQFSQAQALLATFRNQCWL